MRGTAYIKYLLMTIIALSMTFAMVACAGATPPAQPMSAHLWVEGLPQGELITVTVANHTQLNYVGGQGSYDFAIAGQPGETIRVIAGGKEVQSFAYEPGVPAYISLVYSSGIVTASTYQPGDPIPTPHAVTIAPEPVTERTGIGLDGPWVVAIAFLLAIVAVGCAVAIRHKDK